jgi:xanthine dehydrogenase accessory factor
MTGWLDAVLSARRGCALVTLAAARGSTPREAGTKMAVGEDFVAGSIGGGHLEYRSIAIARELLAVPALASPRLQRFPLGASLGQCCGGVATVLIERVDAATDGCLRALAQHLAAATPAVLATVVEGAAPGKLVVTATGIAGAIPDATLETAAVTEARALLATAAADPRLFAPPRAGAASPLLLLEPQRDSTFPVIVFGAGHVGRALVATLSRLRTRIVWVDARAEAFPAAVPINVTVEVTDAPEAIVAAAPPGAHFLVLTHSHDLDFGLTEGILERGDFAYLGLIGSTAKRNSFERRLAQRGVAESLYRRVTCPIGIPGIAGKDPEAIAIAVAAELLRLRSRAATAATGEPRSPRSSLARPA